MNSSADTSGELRTRLAEVRSRMASAAKRSHRSVDEITLVAVSKTHPAPGVREAIAAGVTDLGENRVQEADGKISEVGRDAARWHLIGHLQSNKARRAVELFDMIHSLDSIALARKLNRACEDLNRPEFPVLIQVDLGHEPTKFGADEEELMNLVSAVKECERLRLAGLIKLPPFFCGAGQKRAFFLRIRQLRDHISHPGVFWDRKDGLSNVQ